MTCKERSTGSHRRLSANVIPDPVERLGKDLGGKDDVALCLGDKRRYRIGFLVPDVLAIDLGNQRTGIKDNHRLTHGWLGSGIRHRAAWPGPQAPQYPAPRACEGLPHCCARHEGALAVRVQINTCENVDTMLC